jgi:hypothetical protein
MFRQERNIEMCEQLVVDIISINHWVRERSSGIGRVKEGGDHVLF